MKLDNLQAPKRATGRTTRLLDEAIRLANEGRAVYVIARQATMLQEEINKRLPNSGIKCEESIPYGFSWPAMRVIGSHPNCVWLIDHYAIESDRQFAAMFEMMMRFDKQ